jgi:hypothetical protein
VGALVSMGITLLTIDHWTFDVAAFPIFIVCMASVQTFLVGFEPGPRLLRARQHDAVADAVSDASATG